MSTVDAALEAVGGGKAPCSCEPMREMRAALADRNGLARECADLRDQVAELTEQVAALTPLATAGRMFVIACQDDDAAGRDAAQQELVDAAEAWWDR